MVWVGGALPILVIVLVVNSIFLKAQLKTGPIIVPKRRMFGCIVIAWLLVILVDMSRH